MSGPSPFGGSNPLENLLADLLKLMSTASPVQWDLARQLAHAVATDGQPEQNVDPLERIRLEELTRVADLHIAGATGLNTSTTGGLISVHAVSRSEWAWRTLDAWRPLLESIASSLTSRPGEGGPKPGPPGLGGGGLGGGGLGGGGLGGGGLGGGGLGGGGLGGGGLGDLGSSWAELVGSLGQVMGPTLLGLQVGSAIGHLARRAMGQYVLPVPRPISDELLMVPANIDAFAGDWSLPLDDVRLWVCLSELAHHGVLGRPHVRKRMEELLTAYVGGFKPNTSALEELLAGLDPSDPSAIQAAMGDPSTLLGERSTPEQRSVATQMEALVVTVEGYVDHVMDLVGAKLIRSYASLAEALRRQRVERDGGEAMVEQLFGLEMSQACFERGGAFVRGVLDRAGPEALGRLWESVATLPTPAEVDAPGLWLARISLPEAQA